MREAEPVGIALRTTIGHPGMPTVHCEQAPRSVPGLLARTGPANATTGPTFPIRPQPSREGTASQPVAASPHSLRPHPFLCEDHP